jgi:two-component system response regulator
MTTKTILLIEDDDNDAFFVQRAMKKTGMVNPIQVACDGQEAINYLQGVGKFAQREHFPLPGLILLDLKLPFVMGLDVLKWIRQQFDLSPIVIILSSSAEEKDVAMAYRLGANGYLVKQAEVGRLEIMVKAINDFWLMQNTPPPDATAEAAPRNPSNFHAQELAGYRRSSTNQSPSRIHSTGCRSDL